MYLKSDKLDSTAQHQTETAATGKATTNLINIGELDAMDDCVIVIPSCDKYSDLWEGLNNSFKKFWPDCPYEMYLVSNEKDGFIGANNIKIGIDRGWSANLLRGLDGINHEYVLLWIDDLYLIERVNTDNVMAIINHAITERYDYLRLNPVPPPPRVDLIINDNEIGRLPESDYYRTSTICSVWRREVLMDLLDPAESAWEFECKGSRRSGKYYRFYASLKKNIRVSNTVIKGVWDPSALSIVKDLGLVEGPGERAVMGGYEHLINRAKRIRSDIFSLLPRKIRTFIKNGI